jgi:His-Xaa-Ser system radical SAM maturase HxsC
MLTLWTRSAEFVNFESGPAPVVRLSRSRSRPVPIRQDEFFLSNGEVAPDGFKGVVVVKAEDGATKIPHGDHPTIILPHEFSYLGGGDIVRCEPDNKRFRVLFRSSSQQNSFLLTERCNHYCLMCSQPPRDINDDWIFDELMDVIPLIPVDTENIGFTGGEPTLLGERFVELIRACKSYLPHTSLHVLSNGRAFVNSDFCAAISRIDHNDLMFGIPLYADVSSVHDYIVQADGAFDETIRGVINLNRHAVNTELRVVLHKQSIPRLNQLAEFITRNLTFVDHVALMGLEVTGFTKANLPALWIDPFDYQLQLAEAALFLEAAGINVSIYNLQHCLLDRRIWHLSRKSISDWKNDYLAECESCPVIGQCGGLFSTGMSKISDHIQRI